MEQDRPYEGWGSLLPSSRIARDGNLIAVLICGSLLLACCSIAFWMATL